MCAMCCATYTSIAFQDALHQSAVMRTIIESMEEEYRGKSARYLEIGFLTRVRAADVRNDGYGLPKTSCITTPRSSRARAPSPSKAEPCMVAQMLGRSAASS